MNHYFDMAIVGGGIVGLATAYKLQRQFPEMSLVILEKEDRLAAHQTGHNSGVIHSGLYYRPGSLRALNCRKGRRALVAFAKEYGIHHDICGKVVVATQKEELQHMEKVYQNGLQNGVEGIEKISSEQIREIEPFCSGIAGLYVPCTGIIDYASVTEKLAELIPAICPESRIMLGRKVLGVSNQDGKKAIRTCKETFHVRHAIFCGGLFSDKLAVKDELHISTKIVGFRGDYYELSPAGMHKVRNLIYPVPNPEFPFLGVHFTRMIHGGVECGPNAVFTFKREGYTKTAFSLKDSLDALSYRGTWMLFFKHWKFGLDEYRRAFSKRLFHKQLQRLIPDLSRDDIIPGRAGVRAMALEANGDAMDDFNIAYGINSIHVLNAPSPAATACLAIGEHISFMAQKHFGLQP